MIDMPVPLRWVRNDAAVKLTYVLVSDEWFGWGIAQVHQYFSGRWGSRVGACLSYHGIFVPDADAATEAQAKRWAERWTRAQWPYLERQLYLRATTSPMARSMWRQLAEAGRAPVLRCVLEPVSGSSTRHDSGKA